MAAKKKATQKPASKKAARKRGRPSKYTPAIAAEICARLATGESLRSICSDESLPPESTVRTWAVDDHQGFFAQYARARDIGLDAIADETMEISDNGSNDWMERNGQDSEGWAINGEHVQRSRLRVDVRKWYLSKLAPKRYGDRLSVTQETAVEEAGTEDLVSELKRQCEAQGIDLSALLK